MNFDNLNHGHLQSQPQRPKTFNEPVWTRQLPPPWPGLLSDIFEGQVATAHAAFVRLVTAIKSDEGEGLEATEEATINDLISELLRFLLSLEDDYIRFLLTDLLPPYYPSDLNLERNPISDFFVLNQATLAADVNPVLPEGQQDRHHPQVMALKGQLVNFVRGLFSNLQKQNREQERGRVSGRRRGRVRERRHGRGRGQLRG